MNINDANLTHALSKFCKEMYSRLAEKESQGYSGWNDENKVSSHILGRELVTDATEVFPGEKYDKLVDIANRAMILWHRKTPNTKEENSNSGPNGLPNKQSVPLPFEFGYCCRKCGETFSGEALPLLHRC